MKFPFPKNSGVEPRNKAAADTGGCSGAHQAFDAPFPAKVCRTVWHRHIEHRDVRRPVFGRRGVVLRAPKVLVNSSEAAVLPIPGFPIPGFPMRGFAIPGILVTAFLVAGILTGLTEPEARAADSFGSRMFRDESNAERGRGVPSDAVIKDHPMNDRPGPRDIEHDRTQPSPRGDDGSGRRKDSFAGITPSGNSAAPFGGAGAEQHEGSQADPLDGWNELEEAE